MNDLLRSIVAVLLLLVTALAVHADEPGDEFFEKSIRPLLVENCWACHGPEKQWNNLRLDSAESVARGGDAGKVMVAGKPEESLLYQAVSRAGDLQMPPDDPLKPEQVQLLKRWIEMGAPWPKSSAKPTSQAWKEHWAFQPLRVRPSNQKDPSKWCRNSIDGYVMERMEANEMQPAAEADRASLIRRVTYSVTGLPPTKQQIDAFVGDSRQDAYERLVDSLLDSPQYGEHLGRMWLDVARYSDTKGYVYAREERFFVNAALYRDWVIDAFNNDLPYDRFVQLQIAADQIDPNNPRSLAAMGLLTLGRRFLGVTHDIIDDRIDVIGRGTMGLTISCARCHDHKYDPIPTADYYSLYGVFQCSTDRQVDLSEYSPNSTPSPDFVEELKKRQKALNDKMAACRLEAGNRVRSRIADYLWAQTELNKYGEEGFDVVIATTDIVPAFVRRWEGYLAGCDTNHPVFGPWVRLQGQLSSSNQQDQASPLPVVLAESRQQVSLHPAIASMLEPTPQSLKQVAEKYAEVLSKTDQEYKAFSGTDRDQWTSEQSEWVKLNQPLLDVLYGPKAPCEVPDEEVISTETFFDSTTCVELWKVQGEVDRWRLKSDAAPNVAVAVFDRATLIDPRVFRRGNPANKGQRISRHFLSLFSTEPPQPFSSGSGRMELAQKIVDPNNPLTARVWVNRLWQHHFGQALVTTPSDFGLRAQPPSHPELLDWLADQFVSHGWSSKAIQRQMFLSSTFRQSSHPTGALAEKFQQVDPDNRMLWRMNVRKLRFEELRDSLLAASDDLNLQPGGKAKEMFSKDDSNKRRTVYGLIDRQFLPSTLRVFDFANPDLHVGRRSETQVPQQSLYFLNSSFLAARAKSLCNKLEGLPKDVSLDSLARLSELQLQQFVKCIYNKVLRREPSDIELLEAIGFLKLPEQISDNQPTKQSFAWSYGFGEVDDMTGKLKSFKALPYFTGSSWQGGAAFPDGKLGWVQLTAVEHPEMILSTSAFVDGPPAKQCRSIFARCSSMSRMSPMEFAQEFSRAAKVCLLKPSSKPRSKS
ncbi:MAG: PSD1 and planctomycete cytochrome C domain-containing protein [Pirellulales bacterium]